MADVVARPAQLSVTFAPPTRFPMEAEAVIGPETARVVVATCPRSAGVAELLVQYANLPPISLVDVETFPAPPPDEVIVIAPPEIAVKDEQDTLPEQETVFVATPYTPFVPFDTSRFDEAGCDVVESPHHVHVLFAPPTNAPSVPEKFAGKLVRVSEVVATPVTPAPPEENNRLL